MKKMDLKKIKSGINKALSAVWKKLSGIKPVDVTVTVVVLTLVCLVIVPSVVTCVINRNKAACEHHMYKILSVLSDELNKEAENGGTYWHDLIINGNYQKLIASLNDKTGESGKYPSSNYYIRTGDEKLSIICKKHKDISEKEIRFSLMKDVNVDVAQRPQIGGQIAYLTVSGPDTYYQNDSLDSSNPSKLQFSGREVDRIIQNLKVCAVYVGGAREELPRSRYTVTTDKLDMTKPGQTHLIIKSNPTSLWDNSAYVPFVIDVIGRDDVAPLIVDGGINGKYELAAWDWSDFVDEASLENGGKEFGASIIRYNGNYYYYPNGLHIVNSNKNNNPFKFALDTEDEKKPAYYIEFDTTSVILNNADEEKVHNGSLKVENELVYIWQETSAKELPQGWIRVYCELKKY